MDPTYLSVTFEFSPLFVDSEGLYQLPSAVWFSFRWILFILDVLNNGLIPQVTVAFIN